jgi:hypothetical protein
MQPSRWVFVSACAVVAACGSSSKSNAGPGAGDGGSSSSGGSASSSGGSSGSSSSSGAGSSSGGGSDTDAGDACGASGGTLNPISAASNFPCSWYFNQGVAASALDPNSAAMISQLSSAGGWGNGNTFQIDWSIGVIFTNMPAASVPANSTDTTVAQTTSMPFVNNGVATPDSDIPTTIPVTTANVTAEGSGFESSGGFTSDGGDDHYLVFDNASKLLYEVYQASVSGGQLASTGSIAIWDPTIDYPTNLRGDVCTSADASGALMAPLLATPDEVAAGTITHALRLILPNSRIQNMQYVRPATHGTGGSTWAMTNGIPYGARLRLHSSFTLAGASPAAEVFITALKTYGMILSDGGDIALSVANDDTFNNKWANLLPNGSHELYGIDVTDFDVVAPTSGTYINFTSYNCVRTSASLIPGTTQ